MYSREKDILETMRIWKSEIIFVGCMNSEWDSTQTTLKIKWLHRENTDHLTYKFTFWIRFKYLSMLQTRHIMHDCGHVLWLSLLIFCIIYAPRVLLLIKVLSSSVYVCQGAALQSHCIIVQVPLVSSPKLSGLGTRNHSERTRVTTTRHIINHRIWGF